MILLLLTNEADCLAHQHRRTTAKTNRHHPGRSAYRASGLVLRGLPEVDRAEAFLSLPRSQALRLHPELGPAFAIVDAAKFRLDQRGVAPDKQGVVLDKVRAEVAEQIFRRGIQGIVVGRTGPQVDPER